MRRETCSLVQVSGNEFMTFHVLSMQIFIEFVSFTYNKELKMPKNDNALSFVLCLFAPSFIPSFLHSFMHRESRCCLVFL